MAILLDCIIIFRKNLEVQSTLEAGFRHPLEEKPYIKISKYDSKKLNAWSCHNRNWHCWGLKL